MARAYSPRIRLYYRAIVALTTAALLAAGFTAPAPAATQQPTLRLYAAPDGKGSVCSIGRPCGLKTAQDATRKILARPGSAGDRDVVVLLRGGTYSLSETWTFGPADSGHNGHVVTYQNYPGEVPVISGGKRITGWAVFDESKGIYRANASGIDTRELFINGRRATRARSEINPEGFVETTDGYSTTDDAMASWRNQSSIEIVGRSFWKENRCRIQQIDGTSIIMQQPCWANANLQAGVNINTPYLIENAYELLNKPGEWYLDPAEDAIYYKPRADEKIHNANVVAPVVEGLVSGEGSLDEPVSNIRFQGLTFSYSTWLAPNTSDGYASVQAGFRLVGSGWERFSATRGKWEQMPAAVSFDKSMNVGFVGDVFTHLSPAALNMGTGSKSGLIQGNKFVDISGTAIQIGGVGTNDHHPSDPGYVTEDNVVSNNFIDRAGTQYRDTVGIWLGFTTHTVVKHNELLNLPYTGISVGWGWGAYDVGGNPIHPDPLGRPVYDTPTTSKNNEIVGNRIDKYMTELGDGGGIYTLSASPGSVIKGNYISRVGTPHYAVYLDEASVSFTVERNVACDSGTAWLNLHDTWNNAIIYNFSDLDTIRKAGVNNDLHIAHNTTLARCDALPASIQNAAGLQTAYEYLHPVPAPGDQDAPSAPPGLRQEAITTHGVQLGWRAASDNVAVTGYEIHRDGQVVAAADISPAIIKGLWPDRTYTLAVYARDAAGNLSPANTLQVTTPTTPPPDTIPPTAPRSVSIAGSSPSSLQLDWASSVDLNGVVGYDVYDGETLVETTTELSFTVTDLQPGTSHSLSVRARDAAGNQSEASTVTGITTELMPLPSALPSDGLALWLPSEGLTAGASEDRIGLWGDESGRGHDAVQSTESSRPALIEAALNGRAAAEFDGVSDLLLTAVPVSTSTEYTVFIVSTVGSRAAGPFYNGPTGSGGYGFYKRDLTRYGFLHGNVAFLEFGPLSGVGQFRVQAATFSAGEARYFVNGQQSGSAVSSSVNPPTGPTFIGGVTSGQLFKGSIAEVIVYDRGLTDAELASVESHLMDKYLPVS